MRSLNASISHHLPPQAQGPCGSPRRGSVIVVVLGLLGMMLILGFVFFTIASQEEQSAQYFAETAKEPRSLELDATALFDHALEQLILGPEDGLYNSALWGGRASLLATLVGTDLQPFDGGGVNLVMDTSGTVAVPSVDADYNGSPDGASTQFALELNQSPVANNRGDADDDQLTTGALTSTRLPQPDVNYTYPDINSPFLAYRGIEPSTGQEVIIPSFHRPQYLRSSADPDSTTWYNTAALSSRVMRPHADHIAYLNDGTRSGEDRFPQNPALFPTAGVFTFRPAGWSEGHWENGGTSSTYDFDADPDGDGVKEAVWLDLDFPVQQTSDGSITYVPLFAITVYDLDALFNLNVHGNAYGDIRLDNTTTLNSQDFGGGQSISQSNIGRSPHEVNPTWAFDADPNGADTSQHRRYLGIHSGGPADRQIGEGSGAATAQTRIAEMANLEWWWLLTGRPELDTATGDILSLVLGRWGDPTRLRNGYENVNTNGFPLPGEPTEDDDGNAAFGSAASDTNNVVFPSTIAATLPHRHPVDPRGEGTDIASGSNGKGRLFQTDAGKFRFPGYANYWTLSGISGGGGVIGWGNAFNSTLISISATGPLYGIGDSTGDLFTGGDGLLKYILTDDPGETLLTVGDSSDAIYGPDETAVLHTSQTDLDQTNTVGRVQSVAPFSLKEATTADDIRSRLTATSADVKAHGFSKMDGLLATPSVVSNQFLYTGEWDGDGNFDDFPPRAGGGPPVGDPREPFRQEVRELLRHDVDPVAKQGDRNELRMLRKISPNLVAAANTNGEVVLRPLMTHPATGLSSADLASQLTVPSTTFGIPDASAALNGQRSWNVAGNPALQEWHARRDRQNLARDIYVLLYTLNAEPGFQPLVAPSGSVHPDPDGSTTINERLREMAQFAVNMVDAADSDNISTVFVYDTDLSNGYTLNDNGYVDNADTDREVVYGVEAQELNLNEAMVVATRKINDSGSDKDHPMTSWFEKEPHWFAYLELQLCGPGTAAGDLDLNGDWQIVTVTSEVGAEETYTTLTDGSVLGSNNRLYTIGATDSSSNRIERVSPDDAAELNNAATTGTADSRMFVDFTQLKAGVTDFDDLSFGGTNPTNSFVPYNSPLDLDLLVDGTLYEINQDSNTSETYLETPEVGNAFTGSAEARGVNFIRFVAPDLDTLDSGTSVKFVLRRRANPVRNVPTVAADIADDATNYDNPWIVVDEMEVDVDALALLYGDDNLDTGMYASYPNSPPATPESLASKLQDVTSTNRSRALKRGAPSDANFPTGTDVNSHDFNLANDRAPNKYTVWQPHYDRPMSTLADLLQVPLYGPAELTVQLSDNNVIDRRHIAAARFLYPDGQTSFGVNSITSDGRVGSGESLQTNLWFRMLQFLEIPSSYGNYDSDYPWFVEPIGTAAFSGSAGSRERFRQFGKINVNTLRHPHVLGGILDDTDVAGLYNYGSVVGLRSTSGETFDGTTNARDWWNSLISARDGLDPVSGSLYLPGLPSRTVGADYAGPFRGFADPLKYDGSGIDYAASLGQTLLRRLPGDDFNGVLPRGLFELGDADEHDHEFDHNTDGIDDLDFSTRYRLLGKVLQNATTRSNAFVVFIKVDFFEAVSRDHDTNPSTPNVVQIGGKLPTSPGNRAVFVIDRTLALESLEESDLPLDPNLAAGGNATFSFARDSDGNPEFNWRNLVLHRKTLQ
ncbi:hypothetical protein [Stratiformator vulcanicus]|uniref:Uncharacterized protein n=1 Tax=Stratiformator vulcanicus TaxID=2527980 RepID=A0A517R0Y8_9PLAN|nr:hypothetical protein [Stratiformator vulcanicus]QDT37538.1 hypothetical protein Pan189_19180 [Stratiformator vulcanicus]